MNQADFIGRCQDLIDQGTKLLATKRPPPPNVVSDYSVDSGAFYEWKGSVATSNLPVGDGPASVAVRISGGQLEHVVDELVLTPNVGPAHHRTCPFRIMWITS